MNALVIAATGTIGSAVVRELASRGIDLLAASREPSARSHPAGVTGVRFDYADEASVRYGSL